MSVAMSDRQATLAGGLLVSDRPSRTDREALLVLEDGSTWHGRSLGDAGAVAGEVRVVGQFAIVGEAGLLSLLDAESLARHVADRLPGRGGAALRGCITAAGATYPIHAAVALAVARGEIGRS